MGRNPTLEIDAYITSGFGCLLCVLLGWSLNLSVLQHINLYNDNTNRSGLRIIGLHELIYKAIRTNPSTY